MSSSRAALDSPAVRRGDVILAVALLALVEVVVLNRGHATHLATPVAALLAAGTAVPVVWRRRAPLAVLAITGISLLVLIAAEGAPGPEAFGPIVALYTVATRCARRVTLAAAAVGVVGLLAAGAVGPGGGGALQLVFPAVLLAVVWLVGDNVRVRRAYVAELTARAERAEADRDHELARAAEQERLRIARELHDVIAHHISVIAIQASGLRLRGITGAAAADADRVADAAVVAIEHTSRQALAELRRLLGVLRHSGDAHSAVLSPQPGLAQLDDLLDQVRAAGLPVTVRLHGKPVTLPEALDLSAYRLIQEALTNVLKHEGPVATDVVIRYDADRLSISVTNAAGPVASDSSHVGHGLIGMRERVAMFGGQLSAGPQPDHGYQVVAELPLAATR